MPDDAENAEKAETTDKPPKKERVIHTRVSANLDDELKTRAASLGVSVSNLVRNVLTHTFGLVEDVIADGAQIARSARGEERNPKHVSPGDTSSGVASFGRGTGQVVAWQEVVLHMNAVCGSCNTIMPRGSTAGLAVTEGPAQGPRTTICAACLAALRGPASAPAGGASEEASDAS